MPTTSEKIFTAFNGTSRSLDECNAFGLRDSVTVQAVPPLFARIDFKALEPEIEKIRQAQIAEAQASAPQKAEEKTEKTEDKAMEITIDDFCKVELKVGEIIACENVPKSSKLLHETVKFGEEVRSVVSGIAKHYKPEELIGKKVVFVTNLAPRKVCGILSEGMILATEDENGVMSLITPDKAEIKSGSKLG